MTLSQLCFLLPFLLVFTASYGQTGRSLQQNDVEWHFKQECGESSSGMEVFKVIQTVPALTGSSQKKFKLALAEIIQRNFTDVEQELEFTVRVFTKTDQKVCISGILVKRGTPQALSSLIDEYFATLESVNPGKQGGVERNCVSEVYIKTKKNKLKELTFSNLRFAN